ncbi:MAG: aminotransferase class V-fold PLP-dependent enzyme [Bacteroidota bacterium]
MNRRHLLKTIGLSLATTPLLSVEGFALEPFFAEEGNASDEKFWKKFAKQHYNVSSDFINLENGYFGVQPNSVLKAYRANIEKVNTYSSKFMRQEFYQKNYPEIKQALADISGVLPEELLITRNATEALNILIQGLDLKKDDEVILQHHDYHSMIETFRMLENKIGITVKFVDVPLVPKNHQEIIDIYTDAITNKTRCILVTHLTHLTGQIMPVKEISAIARSKGIDVIVDAAHSFAQIDYRFQDLNADFIGVNLHKWFGNPLGAGLMYVKKERIKDIRPLYGDSKKAIDDINKLGHYGTPATPIVMTIAEAAKFHEMVGIQRKEARLRYLKEYWTQRAKNIDRVSITTALDVKQSCALASFKIAGVEAKEVVRQLDEKFSVFTVIRKLHNDTVVRVTPNLYNSMDDLDRLLEGIEIITKS